MHQFIMGSIGIDHINTDGLDNRRSNLRVANQTQNTANTRLRLTSKSGYKGVSLQTRSSSRWVAQIRVGGKQLHIGTFSSPEDAARAYDAAALAAWGEFARRRRIAIANARPVRKNPTGYIGVDLFRNGRYRAYIYAHGKTRHIGYFDTADEAAAAYDAAAFDLFGDNPPHLNFPQEQSA